MADARCSCGALTLTLLEPSKLVVVCHCLDCQRRTGAPFGVGAFYPVDAVAISGTPKDFTRDAASGGTWLANLCYLRGKLAQWEQTIEWCEKAMAAGTPQKSRSLANLTAAYAWTGHDKEASETIERLRNVDPHFTALTYQTIIDNRPNPTYQAQTARVLEGMRKAGLPEE
jgi:hypothetical protein